MSEDYHGLEDILRLEPELNKYAPWGIEFNPIPKSGTSNINSSDRVSIALAPLTPKVQNEVIRFIKDSLTPNEFDKSDQFISATIVGDYGSGKTHLLMYVRALLNQIRDSHKYLKPYTIYVDNPGGTILEFIGSIISKIGEENMRKFVWSHIMEKIMEDEDVKSRIKYMSPTQGMFFQGENESPDPFNEANTTSYKKFLDVILKNISISSKKKFDNYFSEIVRKILDEDTQDSTVAYYFYDFISTDFGINKTWEALTSGSLKQMSGKEFAVIKYIVKLLKREGFTHVFILIDEFEDLTAGRLTKTQLDYYVHNLRTLLDQHREWCLLFAMNPLALDRLRKVSPPLADRICVRLIELDRLNDDEAQRLIKSYFSLADFKEDIPFTPEAIAYINEICDGNTRRFLKITFTLLEMAADKGVRVLNKDFVDNNLPVF